MKVHSYFFALFLISSLFITRIVSLPTDIDIESLESLRKYKAPLELKKHLDALSTEDLLPAFKGTVSNVYEHPQLPKWLFKELISTTEETVLKLLTYARIMHTIVATNNFKYIKIPRHYIYQKDGRVFLIAERIYPSKTRTFKDFTFEEARELIDFIQLAHYKDCKDGNILALDQGTAVVDLDFYECPGTTLDTLESLHGHCKVCHNEYDGSIRSVMLSFSQPVQKQLLQKNLGQQILSFVKQNIHDESISVRIRNLTLLKDLINHGLYATEVTNILQAISHDPDERVSKRALQILATVKER